MPELEAVAVETEPATEVASSVAWSGDTGALMRSVDWSRTPLGPVETWSPALRMMVGFMHANRFPLLLWWGPQYVSIYNDAYRPILGTKHPWAMGQPVSACWSEIWHILQPLIDTPFRGGPATWMDDILLEINRYGFVEETHFTIAYSPVPDETAPRGIGGVLATVHEITEKVVGERRIAILRDLGARAAEAKTAEESCVTAAETLGRHPKDIPFALVYLVDPDGKHARLAGAAGTANASGVGPAVVALGEGDDDGWPLARAMRTGSIEILTDLGRRFAAVPAGPWADPPHMAAVAPIPSKLHHQPAGFLVAGISPRLRFDEPYRTFVGLMATQIATAIANARAYEEERERAEALAQIDRAKTAFFSNVSHEFRTPLTLLLGTLEEALAAGDVSDARRGELTIAHRNSLRLLRMVNTLLDFSRVEAGRIEASFEPVDLAALTAELASNFRSACERAGLSLDVNCETLPEPVYVDRDMFEKIVLNLLSNAFKFTMHGGIDIRLSASGGQARLTVADTGSGIPEEHLPRVFERFHRVPGARGRTHEGTGIGLALVQELVKLHGGSVAVESEEGKGTRFTVSIPLGAAHLPAERIGAARALSATSIRAEAFVDEALRWLPGGEAGAPDVDRDLIHIVQSAARRRVLVVDDNADMRDYLARLLRPFHDVDTACDGQEALEAIAGRCPDVVLSDVMMPRLDGFGLVRAIRANPALRDMPVILLSARAGEEAQVEGLGVGADDYLVKPFAARELLARVNAHLQIAQTRREALETVGRRTAQFETLLSEAPLGVYLVDGDFRLREVNPTARPVFGDIPDLIGRDFDEVIHILWSKEYADEIVRIFRRTLETGQPYFTPERIEARRDTGVTEYYEWQVNRIPLPGGGFGVVCYFRDICARVKADARQRLLVNELNHRVKNTLASVQSIAMQTMRNAESVAEFRDSFALRLVALSRSHDLLTRGNWEGTSLRDMARETLAPYGVGADRIEISGPDIRLNPAAALSLSMALHELATNAAKYGALSVPAGKVALDWELQGARQPVLQMRWAERNGPRVAPPRRRGFGSRLIERGIAQDLDGEVSLDFAAEGVRCRMRLPMSERIAAR